MLQGLQLTLSLSRTVCPRHVHPPPCSLLIALLPSWGLFTTEQNYPQQETGGRAGSVLGGVGAEGEMAPDLSALPVEGRIPNAWLPGLWQCPEE